MAVSGMDMTVTSSDCPNPDSVLEGKNRKEPRPRQVNRGKTAVRRVARCSGVGVRSQGEYSLGEQQVADCLARWLVSDRKEMEIRGYK